MTVETLLEFEGAVDCRRDPGPLGLRLAGVSQESVHLAFSGAAPEGLPAMLQSPVVQRLAPGCYRIAAGMQEWRFAARGHFLHRDVTRTFEAAVPPRRVPWRKRLFWQVVLYLAATRAGARLLARRSR